MGQPPFLGKAYSAYLIFEKTIKQLLKLVREKCCMKNRCKCLKRRHTQKFFYKYSVYCSDCVLL